MREYNYGFLKWESKGEEHTTNWFMSHSVLVLTYLISKYFSIKGYIQKKLEIQKKISFNSLIDCAYIIHLRDREDRFDLLWDNLKSVKLQGGTTLLDYTEIEDGVDGSTLDLEDESISTKTYSFQYHHHIDPNYIHHHIPNKEEILIETSPAERGISQAHYNVWYEFCNTSHNSALIMEDDIKFQYGFNRNLENIMNQAPDDFDIIYLSSLPTYFGFEWKKYSDDLVQVHNGVWWLSGYVISKKFAEKLVASLPIIGPVDLWMNYMFEGANVYLSPTNIIEQSVKTKSSNTYSFQSKFPSL